MVKRINSETSKFAVSLESSGSGAPEPVEASEQVHTRGIMFSAIVPLTSLLSSRPTVQYSRLRSVVRKQEATYGGGDFEPFPTWVFA